MRNGAKIYGRGNERKRSKDLSNDGELRTERRWRIVIACPARIRTNTNPWQRGRGNRHSPPRFYFPLDRRHAIATYFRLDGPDCWRRVTEEGVSYGITCTWGVERTTYGNTVSHILSVRPIAQRARHRVPPLVLHSG